MELRPDPERPSPAAEGNEWVLHTIERWLPLSEQFVHALVSGSRHPGLVVARRSLEHRDVFPYEPVKSLGVIRKVVKPARVQRGLVTAALLALSARLRPALVHHHHGYGAGMPVGFVLRRKIPLVLSLHGEDVTTHAHRRPGALAPVLDLAGAVIVPSQFLFERALEIGVRPESLRVIPSGVDTSFFAPSPLARDSCEIVFIGRFVEKKGLDILLQAWTQVRSRVPSARLRLVGFGPLEPMARAAGEGVVLEAAQPHRRAEQVRDALRRARVVATPSRTAADGDSESLLLVNLEAQAAGRPLVTTRHGGIPEFVADGRTALMVPEADPDALAEALVRVLVDDDLAQRLASAGPSWAAVFDVAACTARVDAVYNQLIREAE